MNWDLQVSSFGRLIVQKLPSLDALRAYMEDPSDAPPYYTPGQGVSVAMFTNALLDVLHHHGLGACSKSSFVHTNYFISDAEEIAAGVAWTRQVRERWQAYVQANMVETRQSSSSRRGHTRNRADSTAPRTGGQFGTLDPFSTQDVLEHCIVELFRSVDRTQRGRVTWSDLVAFLVDDTSRQQTSADPMQTSIQPYSRVAQELRRDLNRVRRLVYMEGKGKVAILSRGRIGKDVVRILNAQTFAVESEIPHQLEWGVPEGMEYIPQFDSLAVSFSDGFVRCFDSLNALRVLYKDKRRHTISTMRFVPKLGLLAVGTRAGMISLLDVSNTIKTLETNLVEVERLWEYVASTDLVTDICEHAVSNAIVAGGIDGIITVHHEERGETRKLRGHQSGVSSLSYCHNFNFLVSSGAERTPFTWTINVPNVRPIPFIDTARPHLHPIVKVYCVPRSDQVLSMDKKGVVKIWDVRNYMCVQTIAMDTEYTPEESRNDKATVFFDLTYNNPTRTFYAVGKRIVHAFEYNVTERYAELSGASEHPVASALLVSNQRTIVTASRRDLKIWDAVSGIPAEVHADVVSEDITCMCMDEGEQRIFVGTHNGYVYAFHITSNALLFSIKALKFEISSICCSTKHDLVVVAGAEEAAYVLLDKDLVQIEVSPVRMGTKRSPITCAAFCHEVGMVLLGNCHNQVGVWSAVVSSGVTCRIAVCSNHGYNDHDNNTHGDSESDVSHVVAMAGVPGFVCADTAGQIYVWTLASNRWVMPYHKMCDFTNHNLLDAQQQRPYVTALAYHSERGFLYVGDESGTINMYYLGELVRKNLRGSGNLAPYTAEPSLLHKVSAHTQEVSSLFIVRHPWLLISTGNDNEVKFHTLALNSKGRLCRDPNSTHFSHEIDLCTTHVDLYDDVVIPEEDGFDDDNLNSDEGDMNVPRGPSLFLTQFEHKTPFRLKGTSGEAFVPSGGKERGLLGDELLLSVRSGPFGATSVLPQASGKNHPSKQPSQQTNNNNNRTPTRAGSPLRHTLASVLGDQLTDKEYRSRSRTEKLSQVAQPNAELAQYPDEVQELLQANATEYMAYLKDVALLMPTLRNKGGGGARSVSPVAGPSRAASESRPKRMLGIGQRQERVVGGASAARGHLYRLPPVRYRRESRVAQPAPEPQANPRSQGPEVPAAVRRDQLMHERQILHQPARNRTLSLPPVLARKKS
eukprot:PhM_4_TR14368/c0_g2_i1/m.41737